MLGLLISHDADRPGSELRVTSYLTTMGRLSSSIRFDLSPDPTGRGGAPGRLGDTCACITKPLCRDSMVRGIKMAGFLQIGMLLLYILFSGPKQDLPGCSVRWSARPILI